MICPVCNALNPLEASCPKCGSTAEDEGRWTDWSGPYSPYEPALLTASPFVHEAVCQHAVRCTSCDYPFSVDITVWHV